MSMFLREVMRMHSPVPAVARYLTKPLSIEGLEIPKDFVVDIIIHAVNHHPDIWPDHQVSINSFHFDIWQNLQVSINSFHSDIWTDNQVSIKSFHSDI